MKKKYKKERVVNKNFIDGIFMGQAYLWPKYQLYKKKFLFLHIHKAAGSSIKQSLGLRTKPSSHSTAAWIIRQKGLKWFNKLQSFTIVRNPWDRVISAYHYKIHSRRMNDKFSFDSYVDLENPNGMAHLPSQLDYISYEGNIVVKDTLYFENLDEDFNNFILKHKIKLINPLGKINVSKHKNYRSYYTPQLINRVGDYYAKEIKKLKYEF